MGYSPWGRKESDTTERLTLSPRCNFPLCQGARGAGLSTIKAFPSCPML